MTGAQPREALPNVGDGATHERWPGPLPQWFWLLPLVVLACCWPIDPFWASDDFLALHYAQDLRHALADFTGPQYAATDLFLFYRPLITLSLCWDVWLGGADPMLAHVENAIAHALNATLVALLWRRLLPDRLAFGAGLLWALCPGLYPGVGWAVSRTDGFSALFALLSVWFCVRWLEGRHRTRLPSLLAMALALLCKETVLCLPAFVAIAGFVLRGPAPLRARLVAALRTAWPHALLLFGYLALRLALLGRLGGYTAASFAPWPMLAGLCTYVVDLTVPLRWCNADDVVPAGLSGSALLPWIGAIPALIAVGWCASARARAGALLLALLWFCCAAVPLAPFLAEAEVHHNLRYFTLGFAALAGLLAGAGILPIVLALLAFAPAFVQVRTWQHEADVESAQLHRQLRQQLASQLPSPWFVAGLPHAHRTGLALQYHFGVDRVLLPPFGPGGVHVYAHRPAYVAPGIVDLTDADGLPLALPGGTTLLCRGADLLTTVPQHPLPALPLRCDPVVDCTSPTLRRLARGELQLRIATPGVHAEAMRLVFFTAGGYVGAVTQNHAPAGAAAGEVDLRQFFTNAQWATGRRLVDALEVAATVDLSTEFPVLIEAGRSENGQFAATHRARALVPFRFDRGLPALLRELDGR